MLYDTYGKQSAAVRQLASVSPPTQSPKPQAQGPCPECKAHKERTAQRVPTSPGPGERPQGASIAKEYTQAQGLGTLLAVSH